MTGFGRCEIQKDAKKFTVELKSVNHRYLDVNIRMPKKLNFFETAIRTLLKSYANRGKVDIFITYEDTSQVQAAVKYNSVIAAEYLKYLRQMAEDTGYLTLKAVKIGLCSLQLSFGLGQLGRRDHIHGAGNLHGILDAFHSALDLFCTCHSITCSCS